MGSDTVQDPDRLADTIDQGRALVRAIEALEAITPSSGLERLMARSLVEAYRRRLRSIIGAVPGWAGDRVLGASESIPESSGSVDGGELSRAIWNAGWQP